MKKYILASVISVSIFGMSKVYAEEVIKNSKGENIILKEDFTWSYLEDTSSSDSAIFLQDEYLVFDLMRATTGRGFSNECQFHFNVTAVGVKLMSIGMTNYFNVYDVDGDVLPIRGLGDRFMLINEPFKDGQTVSDNTLGGGVPCSEITKLAIEPIPNENARIYCTTPDGEKNDCSYLVESSIGKSWELRNGSVVKFKDTLKRDDVRRIQVLLNEKGFNSGNPDGIFGRGSREALMKFEESISRPKTGEISKEILEELGFYNN